MPAIHRCFLQSIHWLVLLLVSAGIANGQVGVHPRASTSTPLTPAMQYFGGNTKVSARPQNHRPTRSSRPQQIEPKPFENLARRPTISPYLGLDRIESGVSLPNYHAFVRPQIQQEKAFLQQEAELRRLRHQVRMASTAGIVTKNPTNSLPTTGQSIQFLNTGSYFPGR